MAISAGLFPTAAWKKTMLMFLLIAAIFVRFYNLPNTLLFQGDQGRDAIIVADIFRQQNLVFIGPVTSVGNLYLGPLYYYFMLPFLWLTYPSPLGPVYAVAVLGVLTVYLVYRLGRELIGENGALVAAFFYTFATAIVQTARFSWNPNPAPVVSIMMVYTTYLAWQKHPRWWLLVAVCFSILMQLHYLTLLALPAAGLIWLVSFKEHYLAKKLNTLLLPTALGVVIFLLSLTPLVLFDFKHQGNNLRSFQAMFSQNENFAYGQSGQIGSQLIQAIQETEGRGMHILFEYMIGKNRPLNQLLLAGTVIFFFTVLKQKHQRGKPLAKEWLLISYLGFGILGTAFYQHTIFDHYIAYLFPITALTYGYVFTHLKPRWLAGGLLILFAAYFLRYNLPTLPLKSLGWTAADIQLTSQEILKHISPGEKYNIVLLSESRDINGQNYRYFLTTGHTRPVSIEQRDTIDTLFIINEEKKLTKVTDSPIYEIVVFPNKEPSEVFTIPDGPEITVLRRTTQAPAKPIE